MKGRKGLKKLKGVLRGESGGKSRSSDQKIGGGPLLNLENTRRRNGSTKESLRQRPYMGRLTISRGIPESRRGAEKVLVEENGDSGGENAGLKGNGKHRKKAGKKGPREKRRAACKKTSF